ncbi:MAG: SMI1/KNR4 family protein, partial [Planctomycetia bacterium]
MTNAPPTGPKPDDRRRSLDDFVAALRGLGPDFQTFTQTDPLPTEAELRAIERELLVEFPPDYRQFLSRYNGMIVEAKEEVWPRGGSTAVAPFWAFQYGFIVMGAGPSVPDYSDVRRATLDFRAQAAA